MPLKSLSYEDKNSGWQVESLRFMPFNLLVGGSGAGKTLTLGAIRRLHWIASGVGASTVGVKVALVFDHAGTEYTWNLETEAWKNLDLSGLPDSARTVQQESLTTDKDGEVLRVGRGKCGSSRWGGSGRYGLRRRSCGRRRRNLGLCNDVDCVEGKRTQRNKTRNTGKQTDQAILLVSRENSPT